LLKDLPFVCDESKEWNVKIQEAIYKGAITESNDMAIKSGECYPAWEGSRYERGETYVDGWSPVSNGEPIKMMNSMRSDNNIKRRIFKIHFCSINIFINPWVIYSISY